MKLLIHHPVSQSVYFTNGLRSIDSMRLRFIILSFTFHSRGLASSR